MTKRLFLITTIMISGFFCFAQKNNLVNAWNYIKSKELDKAKAAIDAAAIHDDTKSNPKMWLYRAQTYMAIIETKDEKFKNMDAEAEEKAFTSVINCIKSDKDKIYYEEVKGYLLPASFRLFNKSIVSLNEKQYENASKYTLLLFDGIPYDKNDELKHNNITPEKLNYQLFTIAFSAGDNASAIEYLQKLIDVNYKDPNIYLFISEIYGKQGNLEKQLSYIEKGRGLFEENQGLIAAELNYYLTQNKIDVLLEKVNKAIEVTPDSEILHYTQGTIYQGKKDKEQVDSLKVKNFLLAENGYKKALEIKPDYGDAIYNLGKLYLDRGIDFNNIANNLPPKEAKKSQQYIEKAKVEFAKSIPHLEKAHNLNLKDANITTALKQLYVITGDTDKYNKLKEELKTVK